MPLTPRLTGREEMTSPQLPTLQTIGTVIRIHLVVASSLDVSQDVKTVVIVVVASTSSTTLKVYDKIRTNK
jgi:hypothetical protein